jgi:hypothetical protein
MGNYPSNGSTAFRAFLYDNGAMSDLNGLIDPATGWTLQGTNAINDSGQIVGWGRHGAMHDRAFLLTPVPEPSTLAIVGFGGVGLLLWAWRRRGRVRGLQRRP